MLIGICNHFIRGKLARLLFLKSNSLKFAALIKLVKGALIDENSKETISKCYGIQV